MKQVQKFLSTLQNITHLKM